MAFFQPPTCQASATPCASGVRPISAPSVSPPPSPTLLGPTPPTQKALRVALASASRWQTHRLTSSLTPSALVTTSSYPTTKQLWEKHFCEKIFVRWFFHLFSLWSLGPSPPPSLLLSAVLPPLGRSDNQQILFLLYLEKNFAF